MTPREYFVLRAQLADEIRELKVKQGAALRSFANEHCPVQPGDLIIRSGQRLKVKEIAGCRLSEYANSVEWDITALVLNADLSPSRRHTSRVAVSLHPTTSGWNFQKIEGA